MRTLVMKKYVEISNLNFSNKGDHLMCEAVLHALSRRIRGVEFCVPLGKADNAIRKRHGFKQTLRTAPGIDQSIYMRRRSYKKYLLLQAIIPTPFLNLKGFVPPRQVKAVMDLAGFSFSDFWGSRIPDLLVEYYQDCKNQNQKVILMPKTFGPFSNPSLVATTKAMINTADLVFCRDQNSFEALAEIGATGSHIHIAPDYTGGVAGSLPLYADRYKDRVVIIPNYRMIDKTESQVANNYQSFLINIYKYLSRCGKRPFILLHDKVSDEPVLTSLQQQLEEELDVVIENDPLFIKGIIGQCSSVVSSRLHGIINGLSQCVPTIGCGWAHKYPRTFMDYNCPEMYINNISDKDEVDSKMGLLSSDTFVIDLKQRLYVANKKLLGLNNVMWDLIVTTLDAKGNW